MKPVIDLKKQIRLGIYSRIILPKRIECVHNHGRWLGIQLNEMEQHLQGLL
jgi:hypothetical protein